jgi:drug/metabolite transporter (DMT)-like permease
MKASTISFYAAVLFAFAGIAMGLYMAGSHDHSLAPAHAHINLLGWVSAFLFGLYYRHNPELDASRLARTQVALWLFGAAAAGVGVAGLTQGLPGPMEPLAILGSCASAAAMLLFAVILARQSARET